MKLDIPIVGLPSGLVSTYIGLFQRLKFSFPASTLHAVETWLAFYRREKKTQNGSNKLCYFSYYISTNISQIKF